MMVLSSGCETEKILFEGPYFVRFTETTISKKESFSEPLKIEINNAGPAPEQDLTISYSIEGSAREGIDYRILGKRGVVTIKSGEYFGYIEVQLINNSNNILRSQDITFTLQTVNDSDIQVGQGKSAIGKSFTYTIQDDCLLSGTYSGTRNAFIVPVKDITISSSDCENYLLSNWNINIYILPYDFSLNFIDKGDNTLTIPEQGGLKGDGVVDPVTNKITMNLILIKADVGGKDLNYTISLTPDQP